jgi:predicted TPR repeat methyltransferase
MTGTRVARSNHAAILCERGNACLGRHRYEEALINYNQALTICPDSIQALHGRGIALRSLNRPAEALASHDRALKIRARDAQGLMLRAMALRDLERSEGGDFILGPKLRYAHSVTYLQKLATNNHFAVESIKSAVIRQEAGTDVDGSIAVMRYLA